MGSISGACWLISINPAGRGLGRAIREKNAREENPGAALESWKCIINTHHQFGAFMVKTH
jgi:hypothetical protein